MLKNYAQEHHLLVNAKGGYELVPYDMICDGLKKDLPVRAFLIDKDGATWVVYWHVSGVGEFVLPLDVRDVALFDEFAGKPVGVKAVSGGIALPAADRLYLKSSLPREKIKAAFAAAATL